MAGKQRTALLAIIASVFIAVFAMLPSPASAMTEEQAVEKMQKWVELFSRKAPKIHKATQDCYRGKPKDGESILQHAKRCRKAGEDRYDAELEKFSKAIKKLVRELDDTRAGDKILDELKDLHKCDRLMAQCKAKCGSDLNCVGHCCSEANKCDQKQQQDMARILDKLD